MCLLTAPTGARCARARVKAVSSKRLVRLLRPQKAAVYEPGGGFDLFQPQISLQAFKWGLRPIRGLLTCPNGSKAQICILYMGDTYGLAPSTAGVVDEASGGQISHSTSRFRQQEGYWTALHVATAPTRQPRFHRLDVFGDRRTSTS